MVKRVAFLMVPLILWADIVCKIEEQRIICTYFIDRSDNSHGLTVEFHWYSPKGGDDRVKVFKVPPYHGSVYDYRFLPGRQQGRWKVVAKELETNKSASTTFDINNSDDEFFAD
ncbi:MAG: hypothetical protein C6H99_05200 [Epsilonproteobacteria bacterium]|nr:hypothetical protein [Campylobacterota bacterium]NPA63986.1 hypothetical protein [Campylobacterota bacterium]